ncbi:MAG: alpha/beta hydrolase [Cellvibrionaceae bacterium]
MTKTILMIHGMWGGGWYWQPMKEFFEAQGYQCLTPNLRFHDLAIGEEPNPELGTVSIIDYVDDLENLIKTLPEKPIVMGHSMGGIIAQKLAERDLAEHLVLACPAPPNDVVAISWSPFKSFLPLLFKAKFWKLPHKPSFENVVESSFQMIPVEKRQQYYDQLVYESGKVAVEIGLPFLDKKQATKVASSKVTCPTLVFSAEHDRLTPVKLVEKIANKYPQADYHCFSGQTHWVIAEQGWEVCADYVLQWLSARV